ncbi:hypothetical protein J2R99_002163 [Rhodopseudomonas julia]|uniref:Uncharacterized protein n=1 Tax=Rhodopseudomonas julia TaxID=200617 RepID=A0ABU0C6Z7_9BRAD|nr:hypothetical protein [Rhodopseudomonas julia]MDQ0326294.1 hypothetical protein [Rhodopseudomonas julia]
MHITTQRRVIERCPENEQDFLACEKVLAEALKPFMAEFYLINAGVMAYYIYAEREANIRDIVDSSAEMLRRPELLRYARQAAVQFDWHNAFAIALRMEFVHDKVTALFDLVFNTDYVGLDILSIVFHGEGEEDFYERFRQAVADLTRTDA